MLQLLRECNNKFNVKGIRTIPYHLKTDGLAEWFNQILKTMLKKLSTPKGRTGTIFYHFYRLFTGKSLKQSLDFPFKLINKLEAHWI